MTLLELTVEVGFGESLFARESCDDQAYSELHFLKLEEKKLYISARTLDDLLRKVLSLLLKSNNRVNPTKGENREIFGALLNLQNPRARLSRTASKGLLISPLGEFLWYMAASDDLRFIEHYIKNYGQFSDDEKTLSGAYGPRILGPGDENQIKVITDHLRRNPDTRKAVVQILKSQDIANKSKDVPCTCTLQFAIRKGSLHLLVHMRSNDAFVGLFHDIFAFTMLQELVACDLGVKLGNYKHSVSSLHLYEKDYVAAQCFIEEGFQDERPMPSMQTGSQWEMLNRVIEAEKFIREGILREIPENLDHYWTDIVRILLIWSAYKKSDRKELVKQKDLLHSNVYEMYARRRETAMRIRESQPELPLTI